MIGMLTGTALDFDIMTSAVFPPVEGLELTIQYVPSWGEGVGGGVIQQSEINLDLLKCFSIRHF
jgi:hypothetical protein